MKPVPGHLDAPNVTFETWDDEHARLAIVTEPRSRVLYRLLDQVASGVMAAVLVSTWGIMPWTILAWVGWLALGAVGLGLNRTRVGWALAIQKEEQHHAEVEEYRWRATLRGRRTR